MMQNMNNARRIGEQLIKFGLVGVLNTSLTLATIFLLMSALQWSPYWANAAGYSLGLLTSFTLNRRWTFGAAHDPYQLPRFLFAVLIAYGANISLLHVLIDGLAVDPYCAQLASMIGYTLLSFVLTKCFVFAEPKADKDVSVIR